MADFIETLKGIKKLSKFEGGNVKQLAHLNAMVDAINAILDAATNDPQAIPKMLAGLGLHIVYMDENSGVGTWRFVGQKIADPQ
jgi:hypothetical protein